MAQAPIGLKIRNQRKALGMTQASLAERLGISASYLNLIEHNKRSIGGKLLKRISEHLGVDVGSLDGAAERRLMVELQELSGDPLFEGLELTGRKAAELVGRHQEWAQALVTIYRAFRDQARTISVLSDRLNHDPFLDAAVHRMLTNAAAIRSTAEILDTVDDLSPEELDRFHRNLSSESARLSVVAEGLASFFDRANAKTRSFTPDDEVDDFITEAGGYFAGLEDAAGDLCRQVGLDTGQGEAALIDFLDRRHGVRVAVAAVDGADTASLHHHRCVFDEDSRTLHMPDHAGPAVRRFELTWLLAELSHPDAVAAEIGKSQTLTTPAARTRAARELLSYLVGAVLMPYEAFLEDAERARYDIDLLAWKYTVGFDAACQRLTTLRRPGAEGLPFALVSANPTGHVSRRFALPALPVPRYGSACPLWVLYSAFQTPGRIVRQIAALADGANFLFVAKAEEREQGGFLHPRVLHATMIGCEAWHAGRTVYGDGLDLSSSALATPVGLSCRLCSRDDCAHREEDPIVNRPLL